MTSNLRIKSLALVMALIIGGYASVAGADSEDHVSKASPEASSDKHGDNKTKTLNGSAPRVIAHRGASGYFPEETIEAYTFRSEKGFYNLPYDAKGDPLKEYLTHYRLGVDGVFSDAADTALYARQLLDAHD